MDSPSPSSSKKEELELEEATEDANLLRKKNGADSLENAGAPLNDNQTAKIGLQLVAVALYALLATGKNVVFFPFLRTTIVCNTTDPSIDRHSASWSGSSYCSDLGYVAREAQYIKGLAEGLDQAIHCLALPALGHAIDCFGRRFGVVTGMLGVFFQHVLFFLSSLTEQRRFQTVSLVVLGSMLQGATGIFMTSVQASVRDVQHGIQNDRHHSHDFGRMQVAQGVAHSISLLLVVVLVVKENLEHYQFFWALLSLLTLVAVALLYLLFPETLHEKQVWDWQKANPVQIVSFLSKSPAVWYVAAAVFFFMLSLSSLSIVQAFTVSEFHWTQTYSTVIFMCLSPFAVVSLLASFSLTPTFGSVFVVKIGMLLVNLCMLSLCFASFSSVFVFVGLGFLSATAGCFPAFMQILTHLSSPAETGHLLANMGAVSLAAIAIGNLGFGFLFRQVHAFPSLSFQLGGFPLILLSTLFASRAAPHVQQRLGDIKNKA